MGRVIEALLRKASRTGLRRGLSGEHWAWFVLAGAAWLLRRARRSGDASTTIDLKPGERYLVTVRAPGEPDRTSAE